MILIVDDEASIRTLLSAYLTAEGFEVAEAATGAAALEVALGGDPPSASSSSTSACPTSTGSRCSPRSGLPPTRS